MWMSTANRWSKDARDGGGTSVKRVVAVLGLLVLVIFAPPAPAAEKRPLNVLFLMTDQHHAGWLGCAGNPIVKTPNLDRLAQGGTRFSQMFSPVPYCSPTRAAIVTGRYPSSLGIGRNIDERNPKDPLRLQEPVETYMHHLAARGYHCHQLGKWHLGDPAELSCFPNANADRDVSGKMYNGRRREAGDKALDDGPRPGEVELVQDAYLRQEIVDARQRLAAQKGTAREVGTLRTGRSRVKPEYQYESALADYCIELLKRHQHEPFAITYSISPPHPANVAPSPYYDMYDPARLSLPSTWTMHPPQWADTVSVHLGAAFGEAGWREYQRCYNAQVTMMDAFIGRILDVLDNLELADHTLVIFTSDHGNMLGQHGIIDKAVGAFYDDLVRVPLLVRLPGVIPAGKTCEQFVSSMDLAPTILDYLGAPPLATSHGRSLRGVLAGTTTNQSAIFCERGEPNSSIAARMIRTRQWKLALHTSSPPELYNLEKDPDETANVYTAAANAAVVESLKSQLRAHMQAIGDPTSYEKLRSK
jgi:arylsulfatase A-like enzyme